jgi:hypothetical protein
MHERTLNPQFRPHNPNSGSLFFVDQASWRAEIDGFITVTHENGNSILTQSLERPRELPVRPAEEQAGLLESLPCG